MGVKKTWDQRNNYQLRLIEGLYDRAKKNKMLKKLQTQDMSIDACVEFVQQMELIDQFNTTQENTHVFQVNLSEGKGEFDFKFCNMRYEMNRTNVLPLDKLAEIARS